MKSDESSWIREVTCNSCEGSGVDTDQNGVQYDNPCSECCGTGTIEVEAMEAEDCF